MTPHNINKKEIHNLIIDLPGEEVDFYEEPFTNFGKDVVEKLFTEADVSYQWN